MTSFLSPDHLLVVTRYGISWLITPCTHECGIEIWRALDDGAGAVDESTAFQLRLYGPTLSPRFIFTDYNLPNDGQQYWYRWRHVCDAAPDVEQLWTAWGCGIPRNITDTPDDPDDPDDPPDPPDVPPEDAECLNLINCDAAVMERCSPDSAGDLEIYQYDPTPLEGLELAVGDLISWGWEGYVTKTGTDPYFPGGETNPRGTIKRTSTGLLLEEDYNTLYQTFSRVCGSGYSAWGNDGGRLHGGSFSAIDRADEQPAFLRLMSAGVIVSWGITPREEMLCQTRYRANSAVTSRGYVIARALWSGVGSPCEAAYDGYYIGDIAWDDKTWLAKQINNPRAHTILQQDTTNLRQIGGYEQMSIYVKDGVQEAWTSYGVSLSGTDTALDGQSGVPALFLGGNLNNDDRINRFLCMTSKNVTVTNLPAGWKGRIGTKVATESGGTATIDCNGLFFPRPLLEILNASDEVLETITPGNGGVWGGDDFEYGASLTDDQGIAACIDIEFYDSFGALIGASDVRGVTTDFYSRSTGSITVPAGAVTLVAVANRKGEAQGIACVKHFQLNLGGIACTFKCDYADPTGANIWAWRLPTDENLILRLGFDQFKYPKIDVVGEGIDSCKDDSDGSISLSRRYYDSSAWRHDHHLMTFSFFDLGPGGGFGANDFGNWVYDWARPDIGVNGWGLRVPSYWDGPLAGGGTWDIWPSGHPAYTAGATYWLTGGTKGGIPPGDSGDVIRGEFGKMTDFTYTMWFKPALESIWSSGLASCYNWEWGPWQEGGYTFHVEKGGWALRWTYWDEASDPDAFQLWFRYRSGKNAGYQQLLWNSDHGGVADLTFGDGELANNPDVDTPGGMAKQFAFIGLRVSEGEARTDVDISYEGAGGASLQIAETAITKAYAHSFTLAETTFVGGVWLQINKDQNISFGSRQIYVAIADDDGTGQPDMSPWFMWEDCYYQADLLPYGEPDTWTYFGFEREVELAAGTYWIYIDARTTPAPPIDASHSISISGTDPGTDSGGQTKKGHSTSTSWTSESIDLHYRLAAFTRGGESDGVNVDVFIGNPRTGTIYKLSDGDLDLSNTYGSESAYGINAPRTFSGYDNATLHQVGGWDAVAWWLRKCSHTNDPQHGIMDEVRRYNRALTDAEVYGLFYCPGGQQRFVNTCPESDDDVTDEGEDAIICASGGGIGQITEPIFTAPPGSLASTQEILDGASATQQTITPSQQILMSENFD